MFWYHVREQFFRPQRESMKEVRDLQLQLVLGWNPGPIQDPAGVRKHAESTDSRWLAPRWRMGRETREEGEHSFYTAGGVGGR